MLFGLHNLRVGLQFALESAASHSRMFLLIVLDGWHFLAIYLDSFFKHCSKCLCYSRFQFHIIGCNIYIFINSILAVSFSTLHMTVDLPIPKQVTKVIERSNQINVMWTHQVGLRSRQPLVLNLWSCWRCAHDVGVTQWCC